MPTIISSIDFNFGNLKPENSPTIMAWCLCSKGCFGIIA